MTQNRTLSLILPAFSAAIIAALAQIIIPIGAVPITLQTFAVGLVAAVFKPREATLSAILYLILGAIGLPVFAGGGGGLQAFWLLFWEMCLSLSVVSLACTFLER